MHRLLVDAGHQLHALGGHVAHLGVVLDGGEADVGLHPGHQQRVRLGAQLQLLPGAAHRQLPLNLLPAQPHEGPSACGVHLPHEGLHQILAAVPGLDQYVISRLNPG